MVILGVDPGLASMGFGVLDTAGRSPRAIEHGVLRTPASAAVPDRLVLLYEGLASLCRRHSVREVAVEELFFSANVRTAMSVAHARGVALLAAGQAGATVFEYTPQQVKVAITGAGGAGKRQVAHMVRRILALDRLPSSDDCADALAVAICHAGGRGARARLEGAGVLVPGHAGRSGEAPTARRLVERLRRAAG